jgi:hypothetical protein
MLASPNRERWKSRSFASQFDVILGTDTILNIKEHDPHVKLILVTLLTIMAFCLRDDLHKYANSKHELRDSSLHAEQRTHSLKYKHLFLTYSFFYLVSFSEFMKMLTLEHGTVQKQMPPYPIARDFSSTKRKCLQVK